MRALALPLRSWVHLLPLALTLLAACGPMAPPTPTLNEDLQQLQGLWEARWAGRVVRREIVGAREAVSYYGPDGLLERSHVADVETTRTADGRFLIFRWYNLRATTGPAAGPGAAQGEYLYTHEGSKFTEYHGASPEKPESTEVIIWTRLNEGGGAAQPIQNPETSAQPF